RSVKIALGWFVSLPTVSDVIIVSHYVEGRYYQNCLRSVPRILQSKLPLSTNPTPPLLKRGPRDWLEIDFSSRMAMSYRHDLAPYLGTELCHPNAFLRRG